MFALKEASKKEDEREYFTSRIGILRKTLATAKAEGVKITGGMDASEESLQGKNATETSAGWASL